MTLSKAMLIERLANQHRDMQLKDIESAVQLVLDAMVRSLAKGERIEIRDFGSFTVGLRKPRMVRNPKNGDVSEMPARHVGHFKPGKALRERVDHSKETFPILQD